ncbi:MAG: metal-dependent hydrolase [Clostridium butyricum]|nr:metal-dependent hydrolase [Clostridium butyricum]
MSGKEHVTIGTTAVIGMAVGLISMGNMTININFLILIAGGIIGSYMPDIDSHKSKAAQIFNKLLMFIIIMYSIFYCFGIQLNYNYIFIIEKFIQLNTKGLILFSIITVLGKLSPHRMFTHKWLGTLLFCYSIYLMNNKYLTLGFSMGYILHIIADRITRNGKYLKFFEFKLPLKNSRNNFSISW